MNKDVLIEDIPIETNRTKNAVIQIIDVLSDTRLRPDFIGMVLWAVAGRIGEDGVREPIDCFKVLDRSTKVFGPSRLDTADLKRKASEYLSEWDDFAVDFLKSGMTLKDFYALHNVSYCPL
jgi:hypothetical protein